MTMEAKSRVKLISKKNISTSDKHKKSSKSRKKVRKRSDSKVTSSTDELVTPLAMEQQVSTEKITGLEDSDSSAKTRKHKTPAKDKNQKLKQQSRVSSSSDSHMDFNADSRLSILTAEKNALEFVSESSIDYVESGTRSAESNASQPRSNNPSQKHSKQSHHRKGKKKPVTQKSGANHAIRKNATQTMVPKASASSSSLSNHFSNVTITQVQNNNKRMPHSSSTASIKSQQQGASNITKTKESLRWMGQLDDEAAEAERIRIYKLNRRKRYLADAQTKGITWAQPLSSNNSGGSSPLPPSPISMVLS